MTEAEWLACTGPDAIVKYLRQKKASVRKWRLIAISCARERWHLLSHEAVRNAILIAERFADSEASLAELKAAHKSAYQVYCDDPRSLFDPGRDALGAAAGTAAIVPGVAFNRASSRMDGSAVVELLREVFGNPFRPISIDPSWRTSTVFSLAQGIYEERAFDRMPILADALQDAGCDNADILNHCRGPRPHTRGCFVVDLVLEKS